MPIKYLIISFYTSLIFPFSIVADVKIKDFKEQEQSAVVLIETYDEVGNQVGRGTGFFVNSKGHLITNYHTISNAFEAYAKTITGDKIAITGILEKNKEVDLVRLKTNIKENKIKFLQVCAELPTVGEVVIVMGNSLEDNSTVISCLVSGISVSDSKSLLRLSVPIDKKSNGSPIINNQEQVVGIITTDLSKEKEITSAATCTEILSLHEKSYVKSLSYAFAMEKVRDMNKYYFPAFDKSFSGDYEGALVLYGYYAKKYPTELGIYNQIASCLEELGRKDEAKEAYLRNVRNCNTAIEVRSQRINQIGKTAQTDKRNQIQNEIEDIIRAYSYLARSYAGVKDFSNAVESGKKEISLSVLSLSFIDPNNFNAFDHISKIDSTASTYGLIAYYYGRMEEYVEKINNCKEAIKKYDEILAMIPLVQKSLKIEDINDWAKGRILMAESGKFGANYSIARAYEDLGAYGKAIDVYKVINANHSIAKILHIHLKRHAEAIGYYEKVLGACRDDAKADIYDSIGGCFFKLGDLEQAEKAFKNAIQLNPKHSKSHGTLGIVYFLLNNFKKARDELKLAIEIDPSGPLNPNHRTFLGMCYVELGERDLAIAEYRILKSLDEKSANNLYGFINERL